jgi:hypothetical protein
MQKTNSLQIENLNLSIMLLILAHVDQMCCQCGPRDKKKLPTKWMVYSYTRSIMHWKTLNGEKRDEMNDDKNTSRNKELSFFFLAFSLFFHQALALLQVAPANSL